MRERLKEGAEVELRVLTWDHPRGLDPLMRASKEFSSKHPFVTFSWSARSLGDFEDVPLRRLAPSCDVLAIDHPHVGEARADECLLPLDGLLSADVLMEQAAGSVGPSFASYAWKDHQWALAIDAAAQVSAYRRDLLDRKGLRPPVDFEGIEALARSGEGAGVAMPAKPTHLYSTLLSLCNLHAEEQERREDLRPIWWRRRGIDAAVGVPALEGLYRLLGWVTPDSFDLDPIQVLERMRRTDEIAYVPFVFGYVNYSRQTSAPAIEFSDVPRPNEGRAGSLLGGVGLALSSSCRHPDIAADFVSFVASEGFQRGEYFAAGGQPGHRQAWLDPVINEETSNFFTGTLETIDNACVRPRCARYPMFQREAGVMLHRLVRRRERPDVVLDAVNGLWRARSVGVAVDAIH